ncbi:SOS response-associated peptidase family protein [Pseudomonas sichuanensis]|uniref:SOS response-associated peptidase family protein n=1 Tax=Pseudomonas sichuanensis TaxID=2213015 RepID=UPI00244C456C|nr:SOS response-associated peptidase family protein [Pseudomonas sichuanensis]MDH0729212.1 SOS response-associated peptidase family protein [Pseudomonas sichuanensis]MDH1581414.1 SOS response-associated peptidase family protein [Pseudomonas sichuanensis]MDH1593884.1 SOS response-associated peptidase family protein [Pseudomonas sichuanensis]MDH1600006.1 SOS response-associated peptidase family protein [Pseudomonas sichuanensis]
MCGRFAQYQGLADYLRELQAEQDVVSGYDNHPIARYNVAPGSRVLVLHNAEDGLRIDPCHWGWAPFWAKDKRPAPINARVETVTTGKFFKALWPQGRALVMADGWYEWVADPQDPKRKQPYFIRLKSGAPMFMAALAEVRPGLEANEGDGFVIITAASDAGMVDIHDRRPLVLGAEHARMWIDPELSAVEAERVAREQCLPVEAFEWFAVGRQVGNVRNEGAELILPVVGAVVTVCDDSSIAGGG